VHLCSDFVQCKPWSPGGKWMFPSKYGVLIHHIHPTVDGWWSPAPQLMVYPIIIKFSIYIVFHSSHWLTGAGFHNHPPNKWGRCHWVNLEARGPQARRSTNIIWTCCGLSTLGPEVGTSSTCHKNISPFPGGILVLVFNMAKIHQHTWESDKIYKI